MKLTKKDFKIGNDEEVYWTEIKEMVAKQVKDIEKSLKFQKAILEMAKERIKDANKQ